MEVSLLMASPTTQRLKPRNISTINKFYDVSWTFSYVSFFFLVELLDNFIIWKINELKLIYEAKLLEWLCSYVSKISFPWLLLCRKDTGQRFVHVDTFVMKDLDPMSLRYSCWTRPIIVTFLSAIIDWWSVNFVPAPLILFTFNLSRRRAMAEAEQSQRWSLKAKTALVTGGTKGIGFVYLIKIQLQIFTYFLKVLDFI